MNAYTALTTASVKASRRDAVTVFFTFAFPLLFLVTFGLIFQGREVDDTGFQYIDYIAPGVLSWGIANAALYGVAFTLMQWRNDDLLRLIRLTPTSLTSVFASRYVVALVISVLQTILFIGVAVLPPFNLTVPGPWWLAAPALVLSVTAFLALGMIVGNVAKSAEAVAAIANSIVVPMAFISGSFFPLDMMPGWLQGLSKVLPLRYVNDVMSVAIGDRGGLTDFALGCAALALFTLVFGAVAVRTFRWSNQS